LNWLPLVLGVMLGFGALLTWQGLRAVANQALAREQRRKGYWRLNGGLVLMALSAIAFGRLVRG